jgi:cytochrome c biogenesis protein ResB
VIRRALHGIVGFLSSTTMAAGLLVFVSAWSALATFFPQGGATSREVVTWGASHPAYESLARVLGLHQAFTSFVFVACVLLLGVSTAVCSWKRTKVAIARARVLRDASAVGRRTAPAMPRDLEIACDPALSGSEILPIAVETLRALGIRAKRQGDVLSSVSPWWSVWGSPVFHWALVALLAVICLGVMQRSDGTMAVAVGQTKANAPESYRALQVGAWHDWNGARRSIRVDAFEPDFRTGGIDRGAVPTVSVLDSTGRVIKTQRVYPNLMLHDGSLSINAPACGLSATMAFISPTGAEVGRFIQPMDFSQTATDGTFPVSGESFTGPSGDRLTAVITVPLDRSGGHFGEWIPKQPTARVVVSGAAGAPLVERIVSPNEDVALPGGGSLRLVGIGWYSLLSIVDDRTTPFIYAAMIVAMIGLTVTVLVRQQVVVATVVEGADGATLAVRLRLWRNAPTNRSEIESALADALGSDRKGNPS